MSAAMQIVFNEDASEEIRQLAASLHWTPEETADEVVSNGIRALRRFAFYQTRAAEIDIEKGREALRLAGRNNPPDPGDELPEDLQYLLTDRAR